MPSVTESTKIGQSVEVKAPRLIDPTRCESKKKKPKNFFDQFHAISVCKFPKTTAAKSVDMMDVYRPTRKDLNLRIKDYDLTQTYHILDRDPIRIKCTDTNVTYQRYPPGYVHSSKVQRDDGSRNEHFDFLMELWQKEIDKMQAQAWAKLIDSTKKRKAALRKEYRATKKKITSIRGPDWFQELSNAQRLTIDELKKCIVLDLRADTVNNTKDNLAKLGLVLRPNDKHVKFALTHCCSCPIEFLLVLYQILDPYRKRYSINDRILLSSVYHLTIRSTLKELHVRIPSPPPKARKIFSPPKPKRKEIPKSPYLQKMYLTLSPFYSYVPHVRIYATNEYFDYTNILKANRVPFSLINEDPKPYDKNFIKLYDMGVCVCSSCHDTDCKCIKGMDEFTKMEVKLVTEWSRAQKYYASLCSADYVDILHKATVYISCNQFHASKKMCQKNEENKKDTEVKAGAENTDMKVSNTQTNNKDCQELKTSYKKDCGCFTDCLEDPIRMGNEEQRLDPETTCILAKIADEYEKYAHAQEEEQDDGEWETTHDELVPYPPCTVRDYDVGKVLTVNVTDSFTCNCKQRILDKLNQYCQCDRCVEDRRRANNMVKYRIVDTREDVDPPNRIVGDTISKPICNCIEKYMKRWARFEEIRGVRKVQEALKSLDERFVITGTVVGRDGNITYLIQSVQPSPARCKCYKYEENEAEELRIIAQMPKMPEGCIKYIVQGVKQCPEGNVYVLTGTTENTDCNCMQLYTKFMLEHSICMYLYQQYLKKIAFDTEEYLNSLNPSYARFTPEPLELKYRDPCACDCTEADDSKCCCVCHCDWEKVEPECLCKSMSCPCNAEECSCGSFTYSLFDHLSTVLCSCKDTCESDANTITGTTITPNKISTSHSNKNVKQDKRSAVERNVILPEQKKPEKKLKKTKSAKQAEKLRKIKINGLHKTKHRSKSAHEKKAVDNIREGEEEPEFERYVIYKKWPRNPNVLMATLKKVLNKMAQDGFPLAKLPDIDRLPIFPFWWRFRLHQFYTTKQISRMMHQDTRILDAIDKYYKKTRVLSHDPAVMKKTHTHNWNYRNRIKYHNDTTRNNFFRKGKWASINYTQNFYTILRQYQLPNKTFRDVFFSYLPSKEEDLFPDRIWRKVEINSSLIHRKKC